jgi:hypothetical protein
VILLLRPPIVRDAFDVILGDNFDNALCLITTGILNTLECPGFRKTEESIVFAFTFITNGRLVGFFRLLCELIIQFTHKKKG